MHSQAAWLVLSSCLACGVFTGLYYLNASPRNLEAGSVFSAHALGLRMHVCAFIHLGMKLRKWLLGSMLVSLLTLPFC